MALLDALGEGTAIVVGNDWGASVAWQAARLRSDRFRAVVAMGVPMMDAAPARPTSLFPQTPEALFYTLYFQHPGLANAEFARDPRDTLRRILFAASGDAGPQEAGDDTPNPFGFVSREHGLLAPLPDPHSLPAWLTDRDIDRFAEVFAASGFSGGLNYYRNLDRNWELDAALAGTKVTVPALFMAGGRDTGRRMPGMDEIVRRQSALVPQLRGSIVFDGAGH